MYKCINIRKSFNIESLLVYNNSGFIKKNKLNENN